MDKTEEYVSKGLTEWFIKIEELVLDAETGTDSSTAIGLLPSQTGYNVMASRLPLSETVPLFLWLRRVFCVLETHLADSTP